MPEPDAAGSATSRLQQLERELAGLRTLDERLQAIVCAAAGTGGKGLLSLYRSSEGGLEVATSCGIEGARATDLHTLHTTTIRGRSGQLLGVLSVHLERPRCPTPVEIRLLETCAQLAAEAVEGAPLRDRLV